MGDVQHGQSVWVHSDCDIRKVAAWRVKPYWLVDREMVKDKKNDIKKQVILENGLEDVENLFTDLNKDAISEKYLDDSK